MYILRVPCIIKDQIRKDCIQTLCILGGVFTGKKVSQSGLTGEQNERLLLPGIEPQFHGCSACILLTIPTTLSRITEAQLQQTFLYSCTIISKTKVHQLF
jgi:hypothetical protein